MNDPLSLFHVEPDEKKLPCFHCGTSCSSTLIVTGAIRREIPCCFNPERGCDAAAKIV